MRILVDTGETAAGTLDRYETAYEHLKNFIKWKFKTNDYNIKDINHEFATAFDFWLKSIRKQCHNTAVKYMGQLKKIIYICLNNDWLEKDPLKKLQPQTK